MAVKIPAEILINRQGVLRLKRLIDTAFHCFVIQKHITYIARITNVRRYIVLQIIIIVMLGKVKCTLPQQHIMKTTKYTLKHR